MNIDHQNPIRLRYLSGREYFAVHADGAISRPSLTPPYEPSGGWILRGICRLNNFGRIVETISAARLLAGESPPAPLLYKNGKPRWFVMDLDHGTRRIQMEGIKALLRA
jgi:hypothetical protein